MIPASSEHSSSGNADRRCSTRLSSRGSASVEIAGVGRLASDIVDISATGVCLTLPSALPIGNLYQLNIETQEYNKTISVLGRVCFCIGHGANYRIGFHCAELAGIDEGEDQ